MGLSDVRETFKCFRLSMLIYRDIFYNILLRKPTACGSLPSQNIRERLDEYYHNQYVFFTFMWFCGLRCRIKRNFLANCTIRQFSHVQFQYCENQWQQLQQRPHFDTVAYCAMFTSEEWGNIIFTQQFRVKYSSVLCSIVKKTFQPEISMESARPSRGFI